VKNVIERDGKCQKCGSTRNLEAHHLSKKPYGDKHYFDAENGVCLCRTCHQEFHNQVPYYYTRENTLKYLAGAKSILNYKQYQQIKKRRNREDVSMSSVT